MSVAMMCPFDDCGHSFTSDFDGKRFPRCTRLLSSVPPADTFDLPAVPGSTLDVPGNGSTALAIANQRNDDLPRTIARFQVRERLGEGAFGIAFRAYDPQLEREVALKLAKSGTLTTPHRVQRFFREAKSAANLRHPNIVPLFESGRDGDHYFIASALIDGSTLEQQIEATEENWLPIEDAVRIARKLGETLAYAHSQGIIHRDIKPAKRHDRQSR